MLVAFGLDMLVCVMLLLLLQMLAKVKTTMMMHSNMNKMATKMTATMAIPHSIE